MGVPSDLDQQADPGPSADRAEVDALRKALDTANQRLALYEGFDRLIEDLKKAGSQDLRVEGLRNADWVLVDTGDIIVHVFRPEVRAFYNIEKMWLADHPAAPVAV